MKTIKLILDNEDARDILAAIDKRQSWEMDGEKLMPDGDSNYEGEALGEICRDWLERQKLNESEPEGVPEGVIPFPG